LHLTRCLAAADFHPKQQVLLLSASHQERQQGESDKSVDVESRFTCLATVLHLFMETQDCLLCMNTRYLECRAWSHEYFVAAEDNFRHKRAY
jgi:hypothetical protein